MFLRPTKLVFPQGLPIHCCHCLEHTDMALWFTAQHAGLCTNVPFPEKPSLITISKPVPPPPFLPPPPLHSISPPRNYFPCNRKTWLNFLVNPIYLFGILFIVFLLILLYMINWTRISLAVPPESRAMPARGCAQCFCWMNECTCDSEHFWTLSGKLSSGQIYNFNARLIQWITCWMISGCRKNQICSKEKMNTCYHYRSSEKRSNIQFWVNMQNVFEKWWIPLNEVLSLPS